MSISGSIFCYRYISYSTASDYNSILRSERIKREPELIEWRLELVLIKLAICSFHLHIIWAPKMVLTRFQHCWNGYLTYKTYWRRRFVNNNRLLLHIVIYGNKATSPTSQVLYCRQNFELGQNLDIRFLLILGFEWLVQKFQFSSVWSWFLNEFGFQNISSVIF